MSLLRHESVQAHFATFGELLHIHQLEFCVISQYFIEIVKKFRHTVQMVLKQWDICRNNRRAWKATQNGVFDQIRITSSCFRTQQSRWFWWNYWETEISTWYLIFVRETVHDRNKTVISSIYRLKQRHSPTICIKRLNRNQLHCIIRFSSMNPNDSCHINFIHLRVPSKNCGFREITKTQ